MSDALLYNIAVDTLVTICGLVLIAVALWVIDRYWLVWDWWPLIGPDWRAERHDRKQLASVRRQWEEIAEAAQSMTETAVAGGMPPEGVEIWEGDDDAWDNAWADRLHAMNAELHAVPDPGRFGDLTRPVAQLTHYEVEAVIVQLGRADWLPEHRVAA